MKVIYVICAEEMRIIKQISFVQNCLHSHAKVVSIIAHLSIQQYPTNMLYIVCNIKTTERECKAELQGTHSFFFLFFLSAVSVRSHQNAEVSIKIISIIRLQMEWFISSLRRLGVPTHLSGVVRQIVI